MLWTKGGAATAMQCPGQGKLRTYHIGLCSWWWNCGGERFVKAWMVDGSLFVMKRVREEKRSWRNRRQTKSWLVEGKRGKEVPRTLSGLKHGAPRSPFWNPCCWPPLVSIELSILNSLSLVRNQPNYSYTNFTLACQDARWFLGRRLHRTVCQAREVLEQINRNTLCSAKVKPQYM